MDNDKVKAALKRFLEGYEPVTGMGAGEHRKAAIILADAYAAEHPPDEDEPITPEWLNGLLPWDDYIDDDEDREWSIYQNGHELLFHLADGDDYLTLRINSCWWPLPVYTRGQLLRLLKELEP